MQVPIRKGDKIPRAKADPFMTAAKFAELQAKLQRWKTVNRPRDAAEVARLALMGDFSENVGYQVAKGRLRGLNQRILDVEDLLARAEIIRPDKVTGVARLGHRVTIEKIDADQDASADHQKTYQILGGAETDPTKGVISHSSPLGAALLGRRVGEIINIEIKGKTTKYRITKIV
jgi:transcription elongation factor GreA